MNAANDQFLAGSYFDVELTSDESDTLSGRFVSVSGLSMEVEYDVYSEGGSNYPRFFFKNSKPQVLVLQQGVITGTDSFSELMSQCIQGKMVPLSGTVTLKDSFGQEQRSWRIENAYLQRYQGPDLDSNQPALAVSRVELIYNGCI